MLLLTEIIFGVNILFEIFLDISCEFNILQVNFQPCAMRLAVRNGCASAIITRRPQGQRDN